MPFIDETGGRVNRAGLDVIDLLSGVCRRRGPSQTAPQARRAAQRATQVTKQQAYMLAQVVVEIPVRDRAAERMAGDEEGGGGGGGGRWVRW